MDGTEITAKTYNKYKEEASDLLNHHCPEEVKKVSRQEKTRGRQHSRTYIQESIAGRDLKGVRKKSCEYKYCPEAAEIYLVLVLSR